MTAKPAPNHDASDQTSQFSTRPANAPLLDCKHVLEMWQKIAGDGSSKSFKLIRWVVGSRVTARKITPILESFCAVHTGWIYFSEADLFPGVHSL